MTITANEIDFLAELFSGETRTAAEIDADMEAARVVEAARVGAVKADREAAARAKIENACPKCAGRGNLPQFQHLKGGECFLCGGSGVFSNYKG